MTVAPPNVLLLCRVTRHLPKLRNVSASLTRFTTGDINCGAICLSGQASRCLYGHAERRAWSGTQRTVAPALRRFLRKWRDRPLIRGGGDFGIQTCQECRKRLD